jgi:cyclohexanone monooxygenase
MDWVEHVRSMAGETLYPTDNSWNIGANGSGKPSVIVPHVRFPPYVRKRAELAAKGYRGFAFSDP